jgi:ring-1,2-phenylacetyl-CoA epoxidase subunit PaaD
MSLLDVKRADPATAGARSPNADERRIWQLLGEVPDPEIPVLSIVDLGIVRYVRVPPGGGAAEVGITPTYTGCPATAVIRDCVSRALAAGGYAQAVLREELSPAWSSDWLTPEGREKLRAFGIAPPEERVESPRGLFGSDGVRCPRCASTDTRRVSEFGSTPCKAHWQCSDCLEPFDQFKCI